MRAVSEHYYKKEGVAIILVELKDNSTQNRYFRWDMVQSCKALVPKPLPGDCMWHFHTYCTALSAPADTNLHFPIPLI